MPYPLATGGANGSLATTAERDLEWHHELARTPAERPRAMGCGVVARIRRLCRPLANNGGNVWVNPAPYLLIALGGASIIRGLWIWPDSSHPRRSPAKADLAAGFRGGVSLATTNHAASARISSRRT
jgi:hypothetical protein